MFNLHMCGYYALVLLVVSTLAKSSPLRTADNCNSVFVEYHPSVLEQKWLDNVETWQDEVCAHTPDGDIKLWLDAVVDHNNHISNKFVETDTQSVTLQQLPWGQVLSTFSYRRTCVNGKSTLVSYVHIPIEPTASICRDPRKCWEPMTEKYTQSKEYLVALTAEAFQKVPTVGESVPRAFLFDAGATIPVKHSEHHYNWSGTDWIYSFYQNLGVTFDEVYAWEPAKGSRRKSPSPRKNVNPVSRPLRRNPAHLRNMPNTHPVRPQRSLLASQEKNYSFFPEGVLHFRNVGISTKLGDRENPLEEIRRLCKPEDFVVFKLDIDSAFEIDVVRTLLADKELLSLVDDFYYEHHVRNYLMRRHGLANRTASHSLENPLYTLQGWYDLVTPARRGGMRMHFWP